MMFIFKVEEELHKIIVLVVVVVVLVVGIVIAVLYKYGQSGDTLQFYVNISWILVIYSCYIFGFDGIGLLFYLLSMTIVVLVIIYLWNYVFLLGNFKVFFVLILLLEVGMNGIFVVQDLILFFVFFEIVFLLMYFMIGVWGGENWQYASFKFFFFMLFGSVFMLLVFLGLFFKTGVIMFGIQEMVQVVQLMQLLKGLQMLIFVGMFLGFVIKVLMFLFYIWLFDVYIQVLMQGSVLLVVILLKLGMFGFICIGILILLLGVKVWVLVIVILVVIGIIYGVLGCLVQIDMKCLIVFLLVVYMGFVMFGILMFISFGLNAAMFGMVVYGFIMGMFFFVVGFVKECYYMLEIKWLSGMLKQMLYFGWIMGFCVMVLFGLFGLVGFWGEFLVILLMYSLVFGLNLWLFCICMVIVVVGMVLVVGYLLWFFQ